MAFALSHGMTLKQTLKAIRSVGLSVSYDSATGEFRVTLPGSKAGEGYFTDDRADALATALDMAARAKTCGLGSWRAVFESAMAETCQGEGFYAGEGR